MKKSELLKKLENLADDAEVNETIQGIDGLVKPFDVANATIDDYKNMLASNNVVKAYYQSSFDSAVGSAVTKHDEKFKKEKLPSIIEEEVKKRTHIDETPEQKQLRELQEQIAKMTQEKQYNEKLKTNASKLKEKKLSTDLAKYINDDEDITFFEKLFSSEVQKSVQEKVKNGPVPKDDEKSQGAVDPVKAAFINQFKN